MELKPPSLIIDGFPVAVTSDLAFANDTSDMGTGVAARRAWTQGELERISRRARLGVTAARVGAAAANVPPAVAAPPPATEAVAPRAAAEPYPPTG